jgi:glycosyltransferase involved in cell wall biosynthesis
MVKVSIACLIYKSTRWLQFVYDQVRKYTDLSDKEFYFVANDANENVLNYLKYNNIPHYIHNNTEEQRKEWYINNCYRAWNKALKMAKGEWVVIINSDMGFSEGWLDSLLKNKSDNICIASRLVERGIMHSGTHGIERNFGNVPEDYKEKDFNDFAETIKENRILPGGLQGVLCMKTEWLKQINYFPEGNIRRDSDIFNPVYVKKGEDCIPGDVTFIMRLKYINIEHFTDFNSIVYHFQEGEMRDTIS